MTTKTKSKISHQLCVCWPGGGTCPSSSSCWDLSGWNQGIRGVLQSTARSQWTGFLGLGATWFFILLHTQFVPPSPNALPHVGDCVLPQSFKPSDLIIFNILALPKYLLIHFHWLKPSQTPHAHCRHNYYRPAILPNVLYRSSYPTDYSLKVQKMAAITYAKNANCSWGAFLWSAASKEYIWTCTRHSFSVHSLRQDLFKGTPRKYIC